MSSSTTCGELTDSSVFGTLVGERPLQTGLRTLELGVTTHLITSWHLAPLLVEQGRGLLIEVTDAAEGGDGYREDLYYDLAKYAVQRLAIGQAVELRPYGVAVVCVTPGFLRSEAVLEHLGVTEEDWRERARHDATFVYSETPRYLGRGVAALATDPDVMKKTGQLFASWDLAEEYDFTDLTGDRPNWLRGTR